MIIWEGEEMEFYQHGKLLCFEKNMNMTAAFRKESEVECDKSSRSWTERFRIGGLRFPNPLPKLSNVGGLGSHTHG